MGLRAIGIIPRMIGPCVHTDLLCRFLSGCSMASGFVHPACAAPCIDQNHRSVFWSITSWAKKPADSHPNRPRLEPKTRP